jgi:hypothetical protein
MLKNVLFFTNLIFQDWLHRPLWFERELDQDAIEHFQGSMEEGEAEHEHNAYKNALVRKAWVACTLLMVAFPIPHFAACAVLFTTFLSFCILDEMI